MRTICYILIPALLQLVVSELLSALLGSALDSAAVAAISSVIILPFAIWMFRRDKALHRESAHKKDSGELLFFIVTVLLCFLAGAALNVLLSWIMNLLHVTGSFSNEAQESLLGSVFVMQMIGPGLLVPIAEELIFRGITYTRMRTLFSVWPSVLLSSLLFALYHGNIIQIIYAFPMALILAWIYEKGRSLLYPISFHIGANLITIFVAAFL